MDTCKHVNRLKPAADHSILNPQKWLCSVCGTTESVWACLGCSHVACGRYNEEHAVKHFKTAKHPLAIEVNDKYVYCYECDEYVLNDNAAGDLKIIRSALDAVAKQSFHNIEARGRRILRSHSFHGFDPRDETRLISEDKSFTALWFRRYYLLGKCFAAWRHYVKAMKRHKEPPSEDTEGIPERPPTPAPAIKKRAIVPGVTGLRNLGNTCYMNSVLQVLSHLREFRAYFLELKNRDATTVIPNAVVQSLSSRVYQRQTTLECFQHISDGPSSSKEVVKGGLNGGATSTSSPAARKRRLSRDSSAPVALSQEIHALFRVMWSGKWALVSPHKMLHAVWQLIPFFKGYAQQDAQEFLCELLDKVEGELNRQLSVSGLHNNSSNVLSHLFEGQLISEVQCVACGNKSRTYEPFYELSLEFPDQYQAKANGKLISSLECPIEEMLSKFTEVESLDGKIYACEKCNQRRRSSSHKPTLYTEAEKGLKVKKLPHILRLHLKRFMWSGRNHRGKINVHVRFDEELDMKPYCHEDVQADSYLYQLSAVVMHHGKGFGSGHYTAYCWNEEADSWVHCNDSRMELSNTREVTGAQAYILFYTRRPLGAASESEDQVFDEKLFSEEVDDEVSFNFVNSTIPKFVALKRKLSMDGDGTSFHPPLKRRASLWF